VVERTGSRSVAEAKAAVTEREFRTFWVPYLAREPSAGDRLDEWFPLLIAWVVNNIPFRGDAPAVRVADLVRDRWGDRAATPPGRFRGAALADVLKAWAGG
jgi:hypothetical protein